MRQKTTIGLVLVILAAFTAAPRWSVAAELDEGLLVPAWFGVPDIQFRETDDIDYFWVKPGFSLQGRKLHITEWSDPELLGEKRDAKDSAKATELTESMPGLIRGSLKTALQGIAEVSKEEGNLAVTGQIVDCNAGSKAAKWLVGMGAGSASATWNLKITDTASGEVVLALHHRSISGTNMSEIDDKVIQWLEELGEALKGDLTKLYDTAKKVKK